MTRSLKNRDAFGRFRKAKTTTNRKNISKSRSKRLPKTKMPFKYGHIFSPTCSHCQNMSQDWMKLREELEQKHHLKPYDIGENHQEHVDRFNHDFNTDLKFEGFPTVFKLLNKNEPVQYYDTYYQHNQKYPYRSKQSFQVWLTS